MRGFLLGPSRHAVKMACLGLKLRGTERRARARFGKRRYPETPVCCARRPVAMRQYAYRWESHRPISPAEAHNVPQTNLFQSHSTQAKRKSSCLIIPPSPTQGAPSKKPYACSPREIPNSWVPPRQLRQHSHGASDTQLSPPLPLPNLDLEGNEGAGVE